MLELYNLVEVVAFSVNQFRLLYDVDGRFFDQQPTIQQLMVAIRFLVYLIRIFFRAIFMYFFYSALRLIPK